MRHASLRRDLARRKAVAERRARQQGAFLEALAALPCDKDSVAAAAEAAGVHRSTPYRWRKQDREFAERWITLTLEQSASTVDRALAALARRRLARIKRS